jgi:AbrB family looped-hinge helix DNA binding protein
MQTTRPSTKGQIVLPKDIRASRSWGPGTEFIVEQTDDGVLLRPARRFPAAARRLFRSGPIRIAKTVLLHFAILVCAIPCVAPAQVLPAYTPLSGATYEEVLGRLMPGHDAFVKGARFAITMRFLPPFSPEAQIAITYSLDSKASINVVELSKPLHLIFDKLVAGTGKQDDIAGVASLVKAKTKTIDIPGDLARKWLSGFWRSVSDLSQIGPGNALKLDGTGQVEVDGDATLYQVIYSDTRSRLELNIQGPDPKERGHLDGLDPVVAWTLSVRREVEALKARGKVSER